MSDGTSLDTHYEAVLDEEPDTRAPVYVDLVAREHDKRPIIPAAFMPGNFRATVRRHLGLGLHKAGYHGLRLPLVYLPYACFYGVIGLARLVVNQIGWWWLREQHQTRQAAATANDSAEWARLHAIAQNTRRWRGMVLAAEVVGLIVAYIVLAVVGAWWMYALLAVVTVPMLAHYGRPVDKPIVTPAVVSPRFRTITADVVLRAYYAAGLGRADKADQVIRFGSQMQRDGAGGRVLVDLPYGKSWVDMVKPGMKSAIASGLDVSLNQVFLTPDKTSTRRHMLYVADTDPLAKPAGLTPLLTLKPTDIWQPAPFGLDERGRKVSISLMWKSVLVGAQPRKGKTFAARSLALYAALDPYVRITIADGKAAPDWRPFRLVAHRVIMDVAPNSFSADPVQELIQALREMKKHVQTVNAFLSTLPITECPEGKLTRELSRKYPELRVWLLVMEEFQNYYETDSQDDNKEIAGLLSFLMASGPSAGVILLSSTQKPAGIGAGDVSRMFNRFRDNHAVRFALKCGNRIVSDAILGGDAYSEGFDAASLPIGDEYRGLGYLYGDSDATPMVRTFFADGPNAQRILEAAHILRKQAGTLTGMAAGEDVTRDLRDVLRDVQGVFYAGEAWISWPQLASRLAEQIPEHYGDTNADAISAQVRALGAAGKKGRDQFDSGRSVQGVPLEHVRLAARRREIEDKH